MQWIVGLDALRAFAILFIVAYHFFRSSGWLTGGFVFIEFFLAVSGYLMTAKLLRARDEAGEIPVSKFILRRVIRLWPMLALTILFSLALAFFTPHELLDALRRDSLAAATFSTNIVEIFTGRGYEEAISPNLFGHLWFVALELQLCLVLPLVLDFAFLNVSSEKRGLRRGLVLSLAISIASVLLAFIYGAVWQEADRAYYAPDTQAYAFFLGSALAIWRRLHLLRPRRRRFWAACRLILSLASLVVLSFVLKYATAQSFQWGLPLAALLSVLAIDSLLWLQRERLTVPVFLRPLEFLGRFSFGIYLYHYPIMLMLARCFSWPLALRFAVTLLVSIVLTFMSSMLLRLLAQRNITSLIILAILVIPAVMTLLCAPKESPIMNKIAEQKGESLNLSVRYVRDFDNSDLEKYLEEASARVGSSNKTDDTPIIAATSPNEAKVLIIGDSVCLGAKADIEATISGVFVDAEESRGVEKAVPILNQVAAAGDVPPIVIISLTTNERTFTDELMQEIVDAARGSRVIFVTGYAGPEQPREEQNSAIRNFAKTHDNVFYSDWWEISHDRWDIMYADHIHLDIEGRVIYAQLLYNTIMNTGGLE